MARFPIPWASPERAADRRVAGPGPERDVFLLGSSYSGTTHLGGLLEANLDAVYAGELAHLPAYVDRHHLFDTPLGCLLCSPTGRACPRWGAATVDAVEQAGPAAAAGVLRRTAGGPRLVVDGSKWPEWLRLARVDRPAGAPAPVAVVCARSPFGYAMSARGASGEPTWTVASWWRDVYVDALRTLNLFGVPYVVVRNEDVRRDPAGAVARIAALTGQPEPEGPLRPAAPTHSIGGNVFVQHGYRASSVDVLDRLGLVSPDVGADLATGWRTDGGAMAAAASTTAANRLTSRQEALGFASDVTQCPGLVDVLQTLGYSLAVELDKLLDGLD